MKGFKKVFPDNVDKDYFFYRKNIKHPFLKGLHIIVEDTISVYCKENEIFGGNDVLVYHSKKTDKKLKDVLLWLEK